MKTTVEDAKMADLCNGPKRSCLKDVDMTFEKQKFKEMLAKKGYQLNEEEKASLDSFVSKMSKFVMEMHKKGVILHVDYSINGSVLWFHEWSDPGKLSDSWDYYVEINPTFTMKHEGKEYSIDITFKSKVDSLVIKVHDPNGWFKTFEDDELKVEFKGVEYVDWGIQHVIRNILS